MSEAAEEENEGGWKELQAPVIDWNRNEQECFDPPCDRMKSSLKP